MAITGSVDLGAGKQAVTIDHDPTAVATDLPAGSMLIDVTTGKWYRKKDDGSTTNVRDLARDEVYLDREVSTGIVDGGVLSINVDPTKFDLTAGSGVIVDNWTDPDNAVVTPVSWSAFTAEAPLNLATEVITRVAIDSAGNIVKQTADFTQDQVRDLIIIGAVVHPEYTAITSTYQRNNTVYGGEPNTVDLIRMLGNITYRNTYAPNAANLKLDKTLGQTYRVGVNYGVSRKRPNVSDDTAGTIVTLAYAYRDGSGGFSYPTPGTDVDPDYWDDDSGVLQSVPPNKFTIQRIFHVAVPGTPGTTAVHYGQALYASIDDAVVGIDQDRDSLVTDSLLSNASFRAWLVVRSGTTDLQNAPDAHIISAGKFGDVVSGGGAVASVLSAKAIVWIARKASAGTIPKGAPIYIAGYDVGNSRVLVEAAQANSSTTMPAIGVAFGPITDTADGFVVNSGALLDTDTSAWPVGTDLYVSAAVLGTLTSTKPQGTDLIQKVAQVARQDASSGMIGVFGAGRPNDIPNIAQNKVWLGDVNGVPQEVLKTDIYTATDVIEAIVKRLQETSGPTTLLMGAVADGEHLKRVGATIVGDTLLSLSKFHAYDVAGGISIDAGWTDVTLDTEVVDDAAFTHAADSAEVTINTAGWYWVYYDVSTDQTAGDVNSESEAKLLLDDGGGYDDIGGTLRVMYNGDTTAGGTSCSCGILINLSADDKVKIQARRSAGTGNIATHANGCALTIFSAAGNKGEQGDTGPTGMARKVFGFGGDNFDLPNNDDWGVNSLAEIIEDATNGALVVAAMDDTTEEGVGGELFTPSSATSLWLNFGHRVASSQTGGQSVDVRFMFRKITDNGAVGSWVVVDMLELTIPGSDVNYHDDVRQFSLATIGMDAGANYQWELTRYTGGSDTVIGDWYLRTLRIETQYDGISWIPADALRSISGSDWSGGVSAKNAGIAADSNNAALKVRRHDDTTEEGSGFSKYIPGGVAKLKLHTRSRAETTPSSHAVDSFTAGSTITLEAGVGDVTAEYPAGRKFVTSGATTGANNGIFEVQSSAFGTNTVITTVETSLVTEAASPAISIPYKDVGITLHYRTLADGVAVGSWIQYDLPTDILIPANELWQYDSWELDLASLPTPIVPGTEYQFQLTRTTGDILAGDWVLWALGTEFK